uniref:non-specific serine/threonine protein kinase n=1 Tax=Lepisosteus oculatus TaxID=7918 RepID=W5MYF3_LEPOC
MGHAMCICSRGTVTIENKRYYFIQKLDEGGFSYVDLVEGAQDGRLYALKKILCHDESHYCNSHTTVTCSLKTPHKFLIGSRTQNWVRKCTKTHIVVACDERDSCFCSPKMLSNRINMTGTIIGRMIVRHSSVLQCRARASLSAHRDLKPTNVLLEDDDRPVLMDLGSMNRARIEVKGSREAMTVQDWAAQRCTISYRAPELFNVESHCIIDERTDIWSLGCVLYGMMMLEGPFDMIFQKGDSVALAVQNPVTVPQPCRYSEGLQSLLSSIMVPNPQERPDINWVLNQIRHVQPSETPGDPNSI